MTHVVASDDELANERLGRLHIPRDHRFRSGEKRFGRSPLGADLHDDAVQTAPSMLGLQLGHDGPQLLFCLFP